MKFVRYRIPRVLLLAVMLLCLVSCSPSETGKKVTDTVQGFAAAVKREYGEIREFFEEVPISTEPSVSVETEVPEEAQPLQMRTLPHTEILLSVYNPDPARVTVYAAGDTEMQPTPAGKDLTDEERMGYTTVPMPEHRDVTYFRDYLEKYGVTVEVEVSANPAPAGEVFAICYAGISDEDGYYINTDVPVTLHVSGDKPGKTADKEGSGVVYLTFDDGPTETDTLRLLDILDTYGVKATFFTIGEAMEKYPAAVRAMAERGHGLGCHSVTHVYKEIYASSDALMKEVRGWEEILADIGVTVADKLFRFPGGSVGGYLTRDKAASMTAMLEEAGYRVFDWNVVSNDSLLYLREEGENAYDYIKENFIETLEMYLADNEDREGVPIVLLLHETVPETIDLMPWMLEYLANRGYAFGHLPEIAGSRLFGDI